MQEVPFTSVEHATPKLETDEKHLDDTSSTKEDSTNQSPKESNDTDVSHLEDKIYRLLREQRAMNNDMLASEMFDTLEKARICLYDHCQKQNR